MKILKRPLLDLLAYAYCILFFITGTLVSLHRYWQYEVSYIDFGQYDRALWLVSRFQEPITYHFVHGKINVLGDHLTPSIFLISPLYLLTDRSEMILVIQALAVAISGYFLYDLGKHVIKFRFMPLSILWCYFLFVGLQNAVITEFHELTVMTLPLMITLWAATKNKPKVYFIFLILTLGFKEITFMLGIGIGIALFFLKKDWRKHSLITILLSVIWGVLAFKVILPYFSGGHYLYASEFSDTFTGNLLGLVDYPEKRRTLFYSFLSFSFLPFFAPQFWFAMLQDYGSRFLPLYFTTRWGLGMHYNAQSAVLLAVSSVYSWKYLLKFSLFKKYRPLFSILVVLNAFFLFRFVLHGPLLMAVNPAFYRHTNDFTFLDTAVKKIPHNAFVMTQNNLAPRFTHQDVRLLTLNYVFEKPEYVLLDMREGQSPNNFLGTKDVDVVYAKLLTDPNYAIVFRTNEQYVFKRK